MIYASRRSSIAAMSTTEDTIALTRDCHARPNLVLIASCRQSMPAYNRQCSMALSKADDGHGGTALLACCTFRSETHSLRAFILARVAVSD